MGGYFGQGFFGGNLKMGRNEGRVPRPLFALALGGSPPVALHCVRSALVSGHMDMPWVATGDTAIAAVAIAVYTYCTMPHVESPPAEWTTVGAIAEACYCHPATVWRSLRRLGHEREDFYVRHHGTQAGGRPYVCVPLEVARKCAIEIENHRSKYQRLLTSRRLGRESAIAMLAARRSAVAVRTASLPDRASRAIRARVIRGESLEDAVAAVTSPVPPVPQ